MIIPHHRENRLFVILAEQEFFFPVVVLAPKFLSGLRMTVGVCEIARMIAQDEAFTLVCLKSPIHPITAKLVTGHRFFFGKQFGKSVLKQHTSKKADHLQP